MTPDQLQFIEKHGVKRLPPGPIFLVNWQEPFGKLSEAQSVAELMMQYSDLDLIQEAGPNPPKGDKFNRNPNHPWRRWEAHAPRKPKTQPKKEPLVFDPTKPFIYCSSCGKPHNGKCRQCRECHTIYLREWRAKRRANGNQNNDL